MLKLPFHLRFAINPIIRYKSDNMGNFSGVNELKRKIPVIVSLTSYKERFNDLELSLYSLLTQSVKPDRIILWLSEDCELTELPYKITKYVKNGLELRFVKDIGSYTKIIYALKEFSNSIIVTADDDVIYPKDWLKGLYMSYISNPDDIQVHRAHRVEIKDGVIQPYRNWEKHIVTEDARYTNFLTGVGGVLYPPMCFKNEVFREDIFLKKAPNADDIWLWIMALLSDRKIRVVKNHIETLCVTNILRHLQMKDDRLYSANINKNDGKLENLLQLYKQNIFNKLIS